MIALVLPEHPCQRKSLVASATSERFLLAVLNGLVCAKMTFPPRGEVTLRALEPFAGVLAAVPGQGISTLETAVAVGTCEGSESRNVFEWSRFSLEVSTEKRSKFS